MKAMKKMLAMLLAVCMLIGMPLCMDVAATGAPEDTFLKLVQAMMIPEHWDTDLDRDTQLALYFTGHVRTVSTTQIKAYIGIVGASSWNYDGSIRSDVADRINFSGTLSENKTDPALLGETNAYGTANTNQWIFTMNQTATYAKTNIKEQYQHLIQGDYVDTVPELFDLAQAAGKRLVVVIVDNGSRGETLNNMIGRTANGGSPTVPLMADTQKANIDHGNNNGTDANGKARAGAHAIVYDETTAARMTGATLDSVTKTLTVNFSEAMTVRKGVMSGLMVLNSRGQLMAQKDGEFAVHPTTDYGAMINQSAYPLTITSGATSGTVALDAAAYNRIINWQNLVTTHNAKHPDDPLRVLFYIGEESTGTDTTYSWRGEAKSNYYMDSLYTEDLRPFMANYKKNAEAGLNDYMVTEITVRNYAVSANGKGYDTLTDALNEAVSGDTVTLLANCTAGDVQIKDGVTLDLNGKTLTATSVFANVGKGIVKDSTDGMGGIKIAKNVVDKETAENSSFNLNLAENNPQLPLYDEAFEGYRFFNCTIEHKQRWKEENKRYQFGYVLKMSDAAFALLKDSNEDNELDADIKLVYTISLTVDGVEKVNQEYVFNTTMMTLAANNASPTIGVIGFDQVGDKVIELTSTNPKMESSTGVVIAANPPALTLTYTNAQ